MRCNIDVFKIDVTALCSNLAVYVFSQEQTLIGMSGKNVDDIFHIGSQQFSEIGKATNTRFEIGIDDDLPWAFTGFPLSETRTPFFFIRRSTSQNVKFLVSMPCSVISAPAE